MVRVEPPKQDRLQHAKHHCRQVGAPHAARAVVVFAADHGITQDALGGVIMCALRRRIGLPGEIPGRLTVVPAESTWGGSGGDEWAEALQEKAVLETAKYRGGALETGVVSRYAPCMDPSLKFPDIYQLRIVLRDISPLIWRRILVRDDTALAQLHDITGVEAFMPRPQ
ncbi:MAG: hypothetical protein ETSY2_45570 [Candidatus Entotheonella gemina]|uniref:Plasmid pRiA4b Orf3-like domain-containing protein n=1 Tax=Candidatus Entotheonella gemina TaxID=1429439 RepID=W4LFP5_9BACT|nr:MAG: hypothetical protein ETSY2_45570 [Candidatus Entotheonella gemina]